jgi:YidC/Oxa1 family membrane protein insertase
MMKIDADVVVMTMPDLETYQIKRSYVRKDIEYVYIPHCMNSLNLTMRKGCTDHFDSVLCTGKHQKEEIIKTEEVYNLPHKELIEAGYPLLDTMIREYEESQKDKVQPDHKTVLIAPSWQKDNIVDSCLDDILDKIKGHDYQVIVRPHPQHVRLMPERMEQLKQKFADDPSVEIQTDFTSNNTVFDADMIITDWSGIGYEYAITTKKPVLFINTPMKIMNPEYQNIDTVPINIWVRNEIGMVVELDKLNEIPEKVEYMLTHTEEYYDRIDKLVHEYVYHLDESAPYDAQYIIDAVFRKVEERNGVKSENVQVA